MHFYVYNARYNGNTSTITKSWFHGELENSSSTTIINTNTNITTTTTTTTTTSTKILEQTFIQLPCTQGFIIS